MELLVESSTPEVLGRTFRLAADLQEVKEEVPPGVPEEVLCVVPQGVPHVVLQEVPQDVVKEVLQTVPRRLLKLFLRRLLKPSKGSSGDS